MTARHGVRAELRDAPVLVALADLEHYPWNAQEHDDDVLQESMALHGQYVPLLVQRSTGYVLKGNGTMDAALGLGWTHVAVVYMDCDDRQAAQVNLMDNAASRRGRTNPVDELAALRRLKGNLIGTGYVQRDVDRLERERATPLRLGAKATPGRGGIREATVALPEEDYRELLRLWASLRDTLGTSSQGEAALTAARIGVAVMDGATGHRSTCACTWCAIARQAGAHRKDHEA